MSSTRTSINFSVRASLMAKGFSLAGWARLQGYDPVSVPKYLRRWAGRQKRPIGVQTRAIIEALEQDTGIKICG